MNEEFIKGELLLWLDCFGKDWVDLNKYLMVEHQFSGEIQRQGYIETNEDMDLPFNAPRDTLLRISDKGLAYLGIKNTEEKIKLEGKQDE